MDPGTFAGTAKGLARNPLGIIALFIVLVYALATVIMTTAGLTEDERGPLIMFVVLFPVLVLFTFAWLVSQHSAKLYAPSDYASDDAFLAAIRAGHKASQSLALAVDASVAKAGGNARALSAGLEQAEQVIQKIATPGTLRLARNARVLWVDDHPENNVHSRNALEALGMKIDLASSTTEGLDKLARHPYAAVISDMGRGDERDAGYNLLTAMEKAIDHPPLIFYTTPGHAKTARSKHKSRIYGATHRPEELFHMVVAAVRSGP